MIHVKFKIDYFHFNMKVCFSVSIHTFCCLYSTKILILSYSDLFKGAEMRTVLHYNVKSSIYISCCLFVFMAVVMTFKAETREGDLLSRWLEKKLKKQI